MFPIVEISKPAFMSKSIGNADSGNKIGNGSTHSFKDIVQ